MQYSAMKTIGVVAKREMAVALKSKMVVGTMLLLILGAIIAPIAINFFSGDDEPDSPQSALSEPVCGFNPPVTATVRRPCVFSFPSAC